MLKQWSAIRLDWLNGGEGVLSLTSDELTFFPVPRRLCGVLNVRLEDVQQVFPEAGWFFWHVSIVTNSETVKLRVTGNVDDNVRQLQTAVDLRKKHLLD
jgi:hypothetical protein